MSQCKDPNNDYLTITQEMFSSWLTKRTWSYCLIWNKLEGQAEDGPADHSSPQTPSKLPGCQRQMSQWLEENPGDDP